jgi:L-ascorbate metabolism protein UlaG (beta-lactamase superfamily)
MKITWYGHSAFRLDFGTSAVLIDPFFTSNPAFAGETAKAMDGATHVLVTHGHGDHVGDTLDIAAKTGAKVVTNYDLGLFLVGKGLSGFEPMNTGGTTQQDGFSVTLVRADHSASMVEVGVSQAAGNANGVIVTVPGGPTVWHMGDTDIFSDMALIDEIHAPDVVMMPIGDRFTMGAKTAAMAARKFLRAKVVIPCHYGSFPIIAATADSFVEAMEGSGKQVVVPHKWMAYSV